MLARSIIGGGWGAWFNASACRTSSRRKIEVVEGGRCLRWTSNLISRMNGNVEYWEFGYAFFGWPGGSIVCVCLSHSVS